VCVCKRERRREREKEGESEKKERSNLAEVFFLSSSSSIPSACCPFLRQLSTHGLGEIRAHREEEGGVGEEKRERKRERERKRTREERER